MMLRKTFATTIVTALVGTIGLTGLLLCSTPADAARIKIAGVSASSEYPPDGGTSYDAKKVADSKLATSWVEGEDGSGLGSWVEFDLGGSKEVQKVRIWSGVWYSSEYWSRSNRAKEIEVKFDDGSSEKITIPDEMKVFEHTFSKTHKTAKVRFIMRGSHSGTTWNDTGISEIQVFDASPDTQVSVRKYAASTTAPADADGNYDPANLGDGINDSMWCEGNKDGDGTGESLTFEFGAKTTVSKLGLVNGIGTSLPYWMKGNRATKGTLTFDDGSTQEVTIKNSMMPQTVAFTPKSTASVTLTINEISKGKEFNDLCISEAYFAE